MSSSVLMAPSILSADMTQLGRALDAVSEADFIHVDMMDGHFVPNLSFGIPVIKACRAATSVPLDVHMMVSNPDDTVDWYADAGASMITVHWEAATHPHRIIAHLHDRGVQAGIVLNPGTPASVLEYVIEDVDMVLLMSVNPGFGGQSFIPQTLGKIRELRALADRHGVSPLIEVDGGVSVSTAADIAAAGADVLVAGSAVFGADDPAEALRELRSVAASAKEA